MPLNDELYLFPLLGYQLIFINESGGTSTSVHLPYTSKDKYQCYEEEIGSSVEMISGRIVWETRGHITKIHYQYDCMGNDLWRQIAAFLRSSRAFTVQYLPDDADTMRNGQFICESLTPPKFAFVGDNGVNYWHDIEFTLREVAPHD